MGSVDLHYCLLLDSMGTRYHQLPSDIMNRADSLDYYVMDVAMSYHRQQQQQAEQAQGGVQPHANIPVNKLQEMIERVRR
jgi:hypothetical protein